MLSKVVFSLLFSFLSADYLPGLIRHGKHHPEVAKHEKDASEDPSRGLRQQIQAPAPHQHKGEPLKSPPAKEVAEQIVEEERKEKSKMPSYKGLEAFRLEEKMGEFVLFPFLSPSFYLII